VRQCRLDWLVQIYQVAVLFTQLMRNYRLYMVLLKRHLFVCRLCWWHKHLWTVRLPAFHTAHLTYVTWPSAEFSRPPKNPRSPLLAAGIIVMQSKCVLRKIELRWLRVNFTSCMAGRMPSVYVRMYNLPEQASTDDIKDFFSPVLPAKIAQVCWIGTCLPQNLCFSMHLQFMWSY